MYYITFVCVRHLNIYFYEWKLIMIYQFLSASPQIAKGSYYLHHVCPSACPHVSARFQLEGFLWKWCLSRKCLCDSNRTIINVSLHQDLSMFVLLTVTCRSTIQEERIIFFFITVMFIQTRHIIKSYVSYHLLNSNQSFYKGHFLQKFVLFQSRCSEFGPVRLLHEIRRSVLLPK